MMKKIAYIVSLIVVWAACVYAMAFILVLTGLFPNDGTYQGSMGEACAHMQIWIAAIGITMFARPLVRKALKMEERSYNRTTPLFVTIAGIILIGISVATNILHKKTTEILKQNKELEEQID